jgi:hypothetical protein
MLWEWGRTHGRIPDFVRLVYVDSVDAEFLGVATADQASYRNHLLETFRYFRGLGIATAANVSAKQDLQAIKEALDFRFVEHGLLIARGNSFEGARNRIGVPTDTPHIYTATLAGINTDTGEDARTLRTAIAVNYLLDVRTRNLVATVDEGRAEQLPAQMVADVLDSFARVGRPTGPAALVDARWRRPFDGGYVWFDDDEDVGGWTFDQPVEDEPTIRVSSFDGDTFEQHAHLTLSWTSADLPSNALLRAVATQNGTEVSPTITTTGPTSGSQEVELLWAPGSDYRLCVTYAAFSDCSAPFTIVARVEPRPPPPSASPPDEPPPSTSGTVSLFFAQGIVDFGYGITAGGGADWAGDWQRGTAPCKTRSDGRTECKVAAPPAGFDEIVFNAQTSSGNWVCGADGAADGVDVPAAISLSAISNGNNGYNCLARVDAWSIATAPHDTEPETTNPQSGNPQSEPTGQAGWSFRFQYPAGSGPIAGGATEIFVKGIAPDQTWRQLSSLTPLQGAVSFSIAPTEFNATSHVLVIQWPTASGTTWGCTGTSLNGYLSGTHPDGRTITTSPAPAGSGCDIRVQ